MDRLSYKNRKLKKMPNERLMILDKEIISFKLLKRLNFYKKIDYQKNLIIS